MRKLLFSVIQFAAVLFDICPACGDTLAWRADHYRGYEPVCPWCAWDDYKAGQRMFSEKQKA